MQHLARLRGRLSHPATQGPGGRGIRRARAGSVPFSPRAQIRLRLPIARVAQPAAYPLPPEGTGVLFACEPKP